MKFIQSVIFISIIKIILSLPTSLKNPFEKFGEYELSDEVSKKYYYSGNIHASWEKAVELCELFEMRLLRFDDSKEEESFRENFASFFDGRDSFIYVGANTTESGTKTNWKWTNGEKLNFDISWGDNQPNADENNEFCLSFDEADPLLYHDITCEGKFPFVCHEEWMTKSVKIKVFENDDMEEENGYENNIIPRKN